MVRLAASVLVATMLAVACASSDDDAPLVFGPDVPGAEIITSRAEVTMPGDETSEVTVTTEIEFGPQFIFVSPPPDDPRGLGIRLAEVDLGPLSIKIESSPNVTITTSNTGAKEVGGVFLESSFAIDGEARSDVVISARSDTGTCRVSGAVVSCPIGTVTGSDATITVIEVRGDALLEGTVTVTTRVRADTDEQTRVTPSPSPEDVSPTETVTAPPMESPSP